VNRIEVLIISNKYDFSTDYVAYALQELGVSYLRINRDEFLNYSIKFLPETEELYIVLNGEKFYASNTVLKSVYYRAPTFLRILQPIGKPEDQLYKFQWASFIRNLITFENALWINNPVNTYRAENKLYQLKIAKQIGFKTPHTIVSNDPNLCNIDRKEKYVIKTLDPGLLRINGKEAFIYTNIISGAHLLEADLRPAPVVIQEYLHPKLDIRVTVVRNKVWAVKILKQGKSISGDWRRTKKDELEYIPIDLPENIRQLCFKLVKNFGLNFGAIDLTLCNGEYYFLEINPTGEWGWLVNTVDFNIHEEIAYLLFQGRNTS